VEVAYPPGDPGHEQQETAADDRLGFRAGPEDELLRLEGSRRARQRAQAQMQRVTVRTPETELEVHADVSDPALLCLDCGQEVRRNADRHWATQGGSTVCRDGGSHRVEPVIPGQQVLRTGDLS
jgi:hypothetical protein